MNAVESLLQFELNRQASIDWRERIPRRSQEPRDYSPLYKQGQVTIKSITSLKQPTLHAVPFPAQYHTMKL